MPVREALFESYGDLRQFLPWVKDNLTLTQSHKEMLAAISRFDNNSEELRYYLIRQSDQKLLGAIGLIIRDSSVPYYEIGYWLRTSERGKGYISQALGLLEAYAFNSLNALRLEIKMAESNTPNRAVAESAGYQYEARLNNTCRLGDGSIDNTVIYAKYSAQPDAQQTL